ncbi:ABC transporter ATP-binding protein [Telmatospirillum sp. J64-1]|uniref:ABC transporter ATP-binding protein n=1 Tax=Telmatospirillum sp. J64-1 TaxID=2502183 RepID=UPI00115F5082|nr:ABC transporter ATP-binding protein [Telmatospirillum sp. J64-1]
MSALLDARNLGRTYRMRQGLFGRVLDIHAVDGVDLSVAPGETLGFVGESGSGKSTTGRMVLGLEPLDAGEVRFEGEPLPPTGSPAWRRQRTRMQMIFQDPLAALDRRLTIGVQVREPLDIHDIGAREERDERALSLLSLVGLSPVHAARYPHELSGGQRQRAVIARALATEPRLLVCDEPVSALDVSIQAQVVTLLQKLQDNLGIGMLFISHDLRVVRQISHRIAVIYLGRIVEEGTAEDLFQAPLHPYTQALVAASPEPGRGKIRRQPLQGDPPNPADRPSGCAFHPRCPVAEARCRDSLPSLTPVDGTRRVACHLVSRQ